MGAFWARRRTAVEWLLWALGIAAALLIMAVAISRGRDTTRAMPATPRISVVKIGPTSSRVDAGGWLRIRQAVHLRTMALGANRTAFYRSFAAYMALHNLMGLRPVRHGRCAVAVLYLYNNLRDLLDAYPGESWQPLRVLIARQPSLSTCAPNATVRQVYAG